MRILPTPKYNVSDGMQQGLSLRSLFCAARSELILFFYLIDEKSSKLVCAHARARACACVNARPSAESMAAVIASPSLTRVYACVCA